MSQIRRDSIVSTVLVYAGFVLGFVNTYFFTREGFFSESQYGLVALFPAAANLMFALSNLGMVSTVYRFYPRYNDNLHKRDNDLLTWALLVSAIGFVLVLSGGLLFEDVVVRKFGRSPELLQYYLWIFPFGLGLCVFSVLEAFAWSAGRSVASTFMRELMFKGLLTCLILLVVTGVIGSFDAFIKLYSMIYGLIAVSLLAYLWARGELNFTVRVSRVTRRFYGKILSMVSMVYVGGIVVVVSQVVEVIIIASLVGSAAAGVYALGSMSAGLVQAPQRGAVAASTGIISQAWKDKDIARIAAIYRGSGINLLIASLGIFVLVWLNFHDAVVVFHLKPAYLESRWIFFFLGLARVVDLGTGVNSTIIGTSAHWRFELISGVVLVLIVIPLTYVLVRECGIIGAGYANLASFTAYNVIRIVFLRKKFGMHPFSGGTLKSIAAAVVFYYVAYLAGSGVHGIAGILIRSSVFSAGFGLAVLVFGMSAEAEQLWVAVRRKIANIVR